LTASLFGGTASVMSGLLGTTVIAGEASESDDDMTVLPAAVVCVILKCLK